MRITKLKLAVAIWAIASITLVAILAATSSPAVYVTIAFGLTMVTMLGVFFVLLGSIRKVGRAAGRSAEATRRLLKDGQSENARAAARLDASVLRSARAVRDSEAARARAATKANTQLNTTVDNIRRLERLLEEVQILALAARNNLDAQGGERAHLADSFTRQSVKLDLYVDEMRAALRKISPSHKQVVLESITAD